jgi:hypothetical protein
MTAQSLPPCILLRPIRWLHLAGPFSGAVIRLEDVVERLGVEHARGPFAEDLEVCGLTALALDVTPSAESQAEQPDEHIGLAILPTFLKTSLAPEAFDTGYIRHVAPFFKALPRTSVWCLRSAPRGLVDDRHVGTRTAAGCDVRPG